MYDLPLSKEMIEKIKKGTKPILDNDGKVVGYEWIDESIVPDTYQESCNLLVYAGLLPIEDLKDPSISKPHRMPV